MRKFDDFLNEAKLSKEGMEIKNLLVQAAQLLEKAYYRIEEKNESIADKFESLRKEVVKLSTELK
jgi:hypothetical protein